MAAESVFTVDHVVIESWMKASIDMFLATVFLAFVFFDRKVLVSTNVLNHIKLTFQFFVLDEFLDVNSLWIFFY